MKTVIAGLVLGTLIVLALVFQRVQNLGVGNPQVKGEQDNVTVTPQAVSSLSNPTETTKISVTVDGREYEFNPSTITVEKGKEVEIAFKNTGQFPHDLVIDELGVKSEVITPQGSTKVSFIPDKSGTYTMYCSVGNHREQGMEGTLEVN